MSLGENMIRKIIDKEILEKLYNEGYSQKDISNKLNISIYTIRANFKFHSIKIREGHSERVRSILAEKSFKDALKTYVCKQCEKTFQSYKNGDKKPLFCSRECYYQYWRDMRNRTKICEICGKEYMPYSIQNYDASKYCSVECLWESRKTEPRKFICENCGITFFKNNTNRHYRFCSTSCAHAFKGRSSLEQKIFNVLSINNIDFEEQKQFGRFWVDFFIAPNIIIECDGKYWHNKPEIIERDDRKNRYFSKRGYTVFRLKESEINNTDGEVVLEVLNNG